jgi:hypothetical protein
MADYADANPPCELAMSAQRRKADINRTGRQDDTTLLTQPSMDSGVAERRELSQ